MKKRYKIIIGIVIVLTILNPTKADYTDYIMAKYHAKNGGRTSYFLIFSFFHTAHGETHIGIFKNFFQIGRGAVEIN